MSTEHERLTIEAALLAEADHEQEQQAYEDELGTCTLNIQRHTRLLPYDTAAGPRRELLGSSTVTWLHRGRNVLTTAVSDAELPALVAQLGYVPGVKWECTYDPYRTWTD